MKIDLVLNGILKGTCESEMLIDEMIKNGDNINPYNIDPNNLTAFRTVVENISIDRAQHVLIKEINNELDNLIFIKMEKEKNIKFLGPNSMIKSPDMDIKHNKKIMNLYGILVKNIVQKANGNDITDDEMLNSIESKLKNNCFRPDMLSQIVAYCFDIYAKLGQSISEVNIWDYYVPLILEIYETLNNCISSAELNPLERRQYSILSFELRQRMREIGVMHYAYGDNVGNQQIRVKH